MTLNVHSNLLIADGIDKSRMSQFNWLEFDPMPSGNFHIAFSLSQEEDEPVLKKVVLSREGYRLSPEDVYFADQTLIVDSGEIIILVDCSMHILQVEGINLEEEIEKARRQIKHGVGIIPGPKKSIAGLIVFPPYGDGEYRIRAFRTEYIFINCVPDED